MASMNVLGCMRKWSFNNVVGGARTKRNGLTFHGENFSVNFVDARVNDSYRSKLIERLWYLASKDLPKFFFLLTHLRWFWLTRIKKFFPLGRISSKQEVSSLMIPIKGIADMFESDRFCWCSREIRYMENVIGVLNLESHKNDAFVFLVKIQHTKEENIFGGFIAKAWR